MTPPSRPVHHWVIGDVHGCADALGELIDQLPPQDRLILCGDVINRGPQIEAAMELAWTLVDQGRAIWLMGNHERSLADSVRQAGGSIPSSLLGCDTYRQLGSRRCRLWQERLDQLPLAYWGHSWVATHAGFDPICWQPHLTIRLAFWRAYDGRFGEVVVGHTPGPTLRRLGQIVLIDTGACYGGHLTAYCPETGESRRVNGCGSGHLSAASPLPRLHSRDLAR